MKEKMDAIWERIKTEHERPRALQEKEDKVVRGYLVTCLAVILIVFGAVPVHAAGGDPIATINNLSTFIFSAIRAIGIIILGFGIVQIGLSLKSHDASQRANGFLTFFGGVVITFAKNILDLVVGP